MADSRALPGRTKTLRKEFVREKVEAMLTQFAKKVAQRRAHPEGVVPLNSHFFLVENARQEKAAKARNTQERKLRGR